MPRTTRASALKPIWTVSHDSVTTSAGGEEPPSLETVEEAAIRRALRHTGGKKGECAELLGIAWPTLRRKLKKYKIDPEDP